MASKKKQEFEFRYYEVPQGELVMALLGPSWIREYGNDTKMLHFHNLMEIGYCIYGDGELILDDTIIPYQDGTVSVIPGNCPHTTNSRLHTKSYWEYLFFDPKSVLEELYPDDPLFVNKIFQVVDKARYFSVGENKQLSQVIRLLLDECRERKNYSLESIRGLLLSLIMMIARSEYSEKNLAEETHMETGMSQISAALDYIQHHYMEHISMSELAGFCNLSETHFRRLFGEYMQMSPVEYLNLVRIQQSTELIRKTRYSMEEVAERVGYTTISTFNRNFRKIIGTSPYQFRKQEMNYHGKILNAKVSAKKGW